MSRQFNGQNCSGTPHLAYCCDVSSVALHHRQYHYLCSSSSISQSPVRSNDCKRAPLWKQYPHVPQAPCGVPIPMANKALGGRTTTPHTCETTTDYGKRNTDLSVHTASFRVSQSTCIYSTQQQPQRIQLRKHPLLLPLVMVPVRSKPATFDPLLPFVGALPSSNGSYRPPSRPLPAPPPSSPHPPASS